MWLSADLQICVYTDPIYNEITAWSTYIAPKDLDVYQFEGAGLGNVHFEEYRFGLVRYTVPTIWERATGHPLVSKQPNF